MPRSGVAPMCVMGRRVLGGGISFEWRVGGERGGGSNGPPSRGWHITIEGSRNEDRRIRKYERTDE